ncbi:Activator of Hsp90 ATPase homolog 1-like protein [Priestia aryabhattai B8W22]|uniref:SRPBCC family protein n=1 Tax=Priestia aryabhattai TaxID=412384 RepID=UPI00088E44DF|nr:Activator of Hsp90 ATPase homolog 1-like protein [Priestia aryabhattai B8W22]
MLAAVEKKEDGYIATYNRPLNHSVEKAWATLTENDKLQKWMSNLEVVDLRKGGTIKFNMNDGTGNSFDISILDFEEQSYLQYEWGEGWVQFELSPKDDGCLLVLKEYIPRLSDHTPKDLSGWHVCLGMFSAILEGQYMDFPKEEWEKWYEKYVKLLNQL